MCSLRSIVKSLMIKIKILLMNSKHAKLLNKKLVMLPREKLNKNKKLVKNLGKRPVKLI